MSWRLDKRENNAHEYPTICMEKQKGAMRLSALDLTAENLGLKLGQGMVEARAMCPNIETIHADHDGDMAFLNALADWADRYTPLVGLDAPFGKAQGLFLDITGCAHLFGGEEEMLKDMISRLHQMGVYAQGAIAPTPGFSWGLARQHSPENYDFRNTIMTWDNARIIALSFPMAALRLPLDMLVALDRVGLKNVKDILDAPRKPLTKRFGPFLLKRLDQMLGQEDEPISPRLPVASLSVERRLAEPIGRQEDIETCIEQLAKSLQNDMEKRGLLGQQFMLLLFRLNGIVRRLDIGLSAPSREPKRIKILFSEKLDNIYDEADAGSGFETIRLCIVSAVETSDQQATFSGKNNIQTDIDELADQIIVRLGAERVLKPAFHQSFIPERATSFISLMKNAFSKEEIQSEKNRPIRLFSNPEPVLAIAEVPEGPPITFRWRRSHYQVARAEGPERIGAEWWINGEDARTRDYYKVEDKSGRRFWIFREGLYERESENRDGLVPRWFMHGLFA
ncbi:Y-family DNA polymerase [Lentilitoribacter sp. EG35]|uniref:Y-family DNA polymerase n=1 Tax=Lentilitoribacter sp. EG35 TaxID=3234192 RepID=UPI0034600689